MILALVMALALVACGNKNTDDDEQNDTPTVITNPDEVQDEMTSSDGKYEVAFVTDVGQLKDKSFNQGTYDGVKLYAANNNLSYKYYQPANGSEATDDDRFTAMKAAVDNGAKVVVCAGFMQTTALRMAASQFTDVSFVYIDGDVIRADANDNNSAVLTNVAGVAFKEEQCGYLAGYAAVKEGYTKLGFTGGGGGTNPACCRYGYGFVQGADAAAKELNEKVEMNYSWQYGATFSASPELQTMAAGWYQAGTEVIFACGGSMFASVVAAAGAEEGKVIGVDVDQAGVIAGYAGVEGMTVTSAMKGLYPTTYDTLTDVIVNGNWDKYVGKIATLGLVSGTDPEANYVQIPMGDGTQWSDSFTQDDYKAMVKDMFDGKITVSNNTSSDVSAADFATVITVDDQGSIKG